MGRSNPIDRRQHSLLRVSKADECRGSRPSSDYPDSIEWGVGSFSIEHAEKYMGVMDRNIHPVLDPYGCYVCCVSRGFTRPSREVLPRR